MSKKKPGEAGEEKMARLSQENRALQTLADNLRRELLQERIWRINFQVEHLLGLKRLAEEELKRMEEVHAPGAVQGQA